MEEVNTGFVLSFLFWFSTFFHSGKLTLWFYQECYKNDDLYLFLIFHRPIFGNRHVYFYRNLHKPMQSLSAPKGN